MSDSAPESCLPKAQQCTPIYPRLNNVVIRNANLEKQNLVDLGRDWSVSADGSLGRRLSAGRVRWRAGKPSAAGAGDASQRARSCVGGAQRPSDSRTSG